MASAKATPTTITIEIADHTALRQEATIVARRGGKAVLRRGGFNNSAQLAELIIDVQRDLAGQEIDAAAEAKVKKAAAATPAKAKASQGSASKKSASGSASKPKPAAKKKPPKYTSVDEAPPPGRPA